MSVTPATVAFGAIHQDQAGTRRAVAIYARLPFRIIRIGSDDPHVHVELAKVPGANVYSLYLTYVGGWPPGHQSGIVTVHTDLGNNASREIHYEAQVQ